MFVNLLVRSCIGLVENWVSDIAVFDVYVCGVALCFFWKWEAAYEFV